MGGSSQPTEVFKKPNAEESPLSSGAGIFSSCPWASELGVLVFLHGLNP
jgi:hypothetical protein